MPDNAEKALKLAQHAERKIAALEKELAKYKKEQADWEKKQIEYIQKVEKSLKDYVHEVDKARAKSDKTLEKRIVDTNKSTIAWVKKNFDTKGFF